MLVHREFGDGSRPVALLHGFLGSGRNLGTLARRLAAADPSLRILVPDHLGHGGSPPLPAGGDLWDLARAFRGWKDRFAGGAPIDVVGHSMGGRVALAAKHQDDASVGRLVLLDIAPGPTDHLPTSNISGALVALPDTAPSRRDFLTPLLEAGLDRGLAEWLLMNAERNDDGTFSWRVDRSALHEAQRRSMAIDLWPVIEDGADARAIRGGRSPFVNEADVVRFTTLGVPVETVADAGHFVHADQLDATADRVTHHLAR